MWFGPSTYLETLNLPFLRIGSVRTQAIKMEGGLPVMILWTADVTGMGGGDQTRRKHIEMEKE
jgi:hypothetical protein